MLKKQLVDFLNYYENELDESFETSEEVIDHYLKEKGITLSTSQLNGRKVLTFMQWTDHHNIKLTIENKYVGFGKHWSLDELVQKYENDKKALIVKPISYE